jgi:hypothetical protein
MLPHSGAKITKSTILHQLVCPFVSFRSAICINLRPLYQLLRQYLLLPPRCLHLHPHNHRRNLHRHYLLHYHFHFAYYFLVHHLANLEYIEFVFSVVHHCFPLDI